MSTSTERQSGTERAVGFRDKDSQASRSLTPAANGDGGWPQSCRSVKLGAR